MAVVHDPNGVTLELTDLAVGRRSRANEPSQPESHSVAAARAESSAGWGERGSRSTGVR